MMRIPALVLLLGLIQPGPVLAVEPDEILSDPVLETRARDLSKLLRCVVCQNQDIDSSNAGVARDLRLLVRERLQAGDTDDEVLQFVVARYGDYVLMNPPLKPVTYALWAAPLALGGMALAIGGLILFRRRTGAQPVGLSDAEERDVTRLIAGLKSEDQQ